jgi:hypothetical protein
VPCWGSSGWAANIGQDALVSSGFTKDAFVIRSTSAAVWTGGSHFKDTFVVSPIAAHQSDAYVVSPANSCVAYVESPSLSLGRGGSESSDSQTQVTSPVSRPIVKCDDSES